MYTAITYEDIIFSGKNKGYGAYLLRKEYKRNVSLSVFISVILFTLSISSPFFLKHDKVLSKRYNEKVTVNLLPAPNTQQTDKTDDLINTVKSLKSTIAFKPPIVVPDKDAEEVNMPTIDELRNKLPSTVTVEGDKNGREIITDLSPIIPIPDNTDMREKPYYSVEEMPVYIQGEEALIEFLSKNIIYPEIARRAGIEGRVTLSAIIEKDGSLTDITVLKGIGGGCDEEAVRVIKLTKWIPGKQNGNPVRVRMAIPILFKLK